MGAPLHPDIRALGPTAKMRQAASPRLRTPQHRTEPGTADAPARAGRPDDALFGVFGSCPPDVLHRMATLFGHAGEAPLWATEAAAMGTLDAGKLAVTERYVVAMTGLAWVSAPQAPARFLSAARLGAALEAEGLGILRNLDGHFAVAVWDRVASALHLARDPFGVCRLYVTGGADWIAFGSGYKALLTLPDIDMTPNRPEIARFLETGWIAAGRTLFAAIHQVLPGTVVTVRGRHWATVRPNRSSRMKTTGTPPVGADDVLDHLSHAVQSLCVDCDQSVGVFLSGGVDSAVVAAALQKVRPDLRLHTFTVGYGPDDPEILNARETARFLGSVHDETIVWPEDLSALMPKAVWSLEDPCGNDEYVCLYALAERAARSVDVVLSGNASDTLFAGMDAHRALWQRQHGGQPNGRIPPHRADGDGPKPAVLHNQLVGTLDRYDGRMGAQAAMTASLGLSLRMPFATRAMIDIGLASTDDQKMDRTTNKLILRSAAARLLPQSIAWRRKGIQHLKHDHALMEQLLLFHRALATLANVRTGRIVDVDQFNRIFRAVRRSPSPSALQALWNLIAVELWTLQFVERRSEFLTESGCGQLGSTGPWTERRNDAASSPK